MTGIWPGFRTSTAVFTMPIEWQIMATECALSWKRGSKDVRATFMSSGGRAACWLAWYAAQEIISSPFRVSESTTLQVLQPAVKQKIT